MLVKYIIGVFAFTVLMGSVYATEKEALTSPQSQFIKMDDDIKLEVLDWGGQGETLVFLAGLTLNAHTFIHIAQEFIDSNRVIGVTRVGHGHSDSRVNDFSLQRRTQDIINVLDNLKIESAIFVGHSVAGGELTYLGNHFPKRVAGLIYLDALQDLHYFSSHLSVCPDIKYANIETFESKKHFYQTQRKQDKDGAYIPFADLSAIGQIMSEEINEDRDYSGIDAPALAINHIPEQTDDFFLGIATPNQKCREEINKLTYLGVADFIKNKPNANVVALQNSQHMIYMATQDKVVKVMKSWLSRVFGD